MGRKITLQEAAMRQGMSVRTLRRMISEGRIGGYRLGTRMLRVDEDEVENLARPIPTADLSTSA